MHIPESFTNALRIEFDGRYRLRWSNKFQEFHLEQKVGQGIADPPVYINSEDDDAIRARDGYWFVMAIRPGAKAPCPVIIEKPVRDQEGRILHPEKRCGATVDVPIMQTAEAVCPVCRKAGRDGRSAMAYWPLNDSLIQYIRRIDAVLGHQENLKDELDARNDALIASMQRDALNEIDAISYDIRKTLGGIEQVGYGRSIIRPVSGKIS